MNVIERSILDIPQGYRSSEAASFMAQLDDQSRLMFEDLEGIGPAELQWQPGPGSNTIGMLLAHIAIVEVFWTQLGPEGLERWDIETPLAIGMDDDGIPIPAAGSPPANLAGKPLAYYRELHAKARAYAKRVAASLAEADLDRVFQRTRRNGQREELNVRWVLYHMLEHFSGHYGQILLLRHLYRDAHPSS